MPCSKIRNGDSARKWQFELIQFRQGSKYWKDKKTFTHKRSKGKRQKIKKGCHIKVPMWNYQPWSPELFFFFFLLNNYNCICTSSKEALLLLMHPLVNPKGALKIRVIWSFNSLNITTWPFVHSFCAINLHPSNLHTDLTFKCSC